MGTCEGGRELVGRVGERWRPGGGENHPGFVTQCVVRRKVIREREKVGLTGCLTPVYY